MYANLRGPSRLLAVCATILLIASASLGVEAGIMIVLGPARGLVFKPFLLLGYLEGCAMFFSLLGIAASIIGIVFYRPYLIISEKIYMYRARRAGPLNDQFTYEDVPPLPPHTRNHDEDGSPD